MKPTLTIASIALLLSNLILSPYSTADVNTPRIDQRQENQQERIEQGINSGALTDHEANRLENQQTRIENREAAAKADGVVTQTERSRLSHQQNKANRNIRRKKHNLRRD